ncbi:TniQ family protein [Oculatella sp. FACHB-28]|uniref:TniQ family protein n=1 Tax=Oculatella sp. FACHB-28 TaxID=2692845 RepID=UPI001686EC67|nr:TniQ family protein [Oculatella sp. FACHB-28]MBD2060484.1 TniQ family protein [Oculatella sp. FACHB-28]
MTSENLTLLNIPERSRLYHLEPIAVGTPYVESLISYICRLAEAHCVSPGILLKKEILPIFRKNYSISFGGVYTLQADGCGVLVSSMTKPVYRKNPNEYGLLAWQYLEGLQLLTLRADLQSLIIPIDTNQVLEGMTGRELGRDLRAWCPECFQQWHSSGHSIYEPLLWSISAVMICPYHHKPLQFHCPHCRKSQRPLTAKTRGAQCSQCFNWLGVRAAASEKELLIALQLEQYLEIAEQMMKFISLG